jgi:hypothetical protein
VCLGIEQRYEIKFVEIGTDKDLVRLLMQSVLENSDDGDGYKEAYRLVKFSGDVLK